MFNTYNSNIMDQNEAYQLKPVNKPELLIVEDQEFVDAIEFGYYPDLSSTLKEHAGEVGVLSAEKAMEMWGDDIFIKSHKKAYYILNKYDGKYYSLETSDLSTTFVLQKAQLYKEALMKLGAKSISISRTERETTQKEKESNYKGEINTPVVQVNANYESEKKSDFLQEIESVLTVEQPNNKPKSEGEIRKYLSERGLMDDLSLNRWLEQLDSLVGRKETMKLSFLTELDEVNKTALEINGNFNKLYSASFSSDCKSRCKKTYSVVEMLEVQF